MYFNIIKRFSSSTSLASDIVICGGGLIGKTLACTLAKNPIFKDKNITLIESTPYQPFVKQKNYSNRVSAISQFSKKLLERLGVWKRINRYQEVNNMIVWGMYSDNLLELSNNTNEIMAYIIENNEILQAVDQELKELCNIQLLYNKKISNVIIEKSNSSTPFRTNPKLVLEDGTEYNCKLLIGSDGVNSIIRKAMGVDYLSWNYGQIAVVATLKISDGINNTAWQRFLPDGPVALLPLTNNLSSLVWSTTKNKAQNLLKLPAENFVDAVNTSLQTHYKPENYITFFKNNIDSVLNKFGHSTVKECGCPPHIIEVEDGSRAAFPLGFGHSVNYVCDGMALVGDAAHRVHPLAGQGVNIGFRDVDHLDNVLSDAIKNGQELGDIVDLKKYESYCQRDNLPVMAFIEVIHRVYTSEMAPVKLFGNVCLQLASSINPLKELINRKALFSRA